MDHVPACYHREYATIKLLHNIEGVNTNSLQYDPVLWGGQVFLLDIT